jgi:sugar O-acyltransferase (sialic acid O-acetyltransferase NeuD family)
MSGVLLIGASGLAREVVAAGMPGVVGILDDDEQLRGAELAGVTVVGAVADAAARGEALLVCIGAGAARREVVRRLTALGVYDDRYATFTAPGARVGSTSRIGAGTILLDGAVVTSDVWIGRHCVVMPNCTLTHDDILEDYVTLSAGASLAGRVRVREMAYIGTNASVRQSTTIGRSATVGMGAVVLTDVPDEEVWAGVPARQLGRAPQ